jgi:nucleotide-binding universal stress UspA family protein
MKSQAHMSDSMQEEARQEAEMYVQAMAERLRETTFATCKLNLTWSVAVSPAVAATISKLAEQSESSDCYDVIAIATHGRGGLKRLVMGSVTEHLLGSTKLPLLIVRPQETETRGEEQGETIEARGTGVEMQTWSGLL